MCRWYGICTKVVKSATKVSRKWIEDVRMWFNFIAVGPNWCTFDHRKSSEVHWMLARLTFDRRFHRMCSWTSKTVKCHRKCNESRIEIERNPIDCDRLLSWWWNEVRGCFSGGTFDSHSITFDVTSDSCRTLRQSLTAVRRKTKFLIRLSPFASFPCPLLVLWMRLFSGDVHSIRREILNMHKSWTENTGQRHSVLYGCYSYTCALLGTRAFCILHLSSVIIRLEFSRNESCPATIWHVTDPGRMDLGCTVRIQYVLLDKKMHGISKTTSITGLNRTNLTTSE